MENYNSALWEAINRVARLQGQTCSGLALSCGLDSTAFNVCKRTSKYGQPRWPSTETISKVLRHTRISPSEFARLIEQCIADQSSKTQ